MEAVWESEFAGFLTRLSTVQEKTLDVLVRKEKMLAHADLAGLAALTNEEEELVAGLQECLRQREDLLERARREGHQAKDLRSLATTLTGRAPSRIKEQMRRASHRSRLLQHHSLVNWVLVQKTLIHLSQLLEIIATGGKLQPTYHKDSPAPVGGALMDRAA
jgi:hypothetical protein